MGSFDVETLGSGKQGRPVPCTHYADGRKLTCFAVAHAAADSLLPLLRHLLVGLGLRDLRTFLLTESCEGLIK